MSTPWELNYSQPMSTSNWIEIVPPPLLSTQFLKQKFTLFLFFFKHLSKKKNWSFTRSCSPLYTAHSKVTMLLWYSLYKYAAWLGSAKPWLCEAYKSNNRLQALQILMLQKSSAFASSHAHEQGWPRSHLTLAKVPVQWSAVIFCSSQCQLVDSSPERVHWTG